MHLAHQASFSIGALEVQPPYREVRSPFGREILQPRVMQVLVALAKAQGAVVSRDELIETCWDGRSVGEDAITLVIMKLRKLADRNGGAFALETIPRVGFRLTVAETTEPARTRPTLVVLEFTHQPGDEEQAWFAEALADELTAGLSKSPLLAVMPRMAFILSDAVGRSPIAIGDRLSVDYVLDGKVRTLGENVRISVDLIQGSEGSSAWSAHYDRPIANLFAMLNEITTAIIGTVEPAVLEREQVLTLATPDHSLQFWRLFVRGRRHFWRSTPEDIRAAEECLEQALLLKPDDVSALAILAHCKLFAVWVGTAPSPVEAIAQAHATALRAVAADGRDAFAHYTLGVVLSMMDRLTEAKAEQRRALELNPYLAAACGEMGRLLAFEGESLEALTYSDRAIAAGPNDPHAWLWFRSKAIARFVAGDYEQAASDAADACARGPERFPLHFLLAACHSAAGHDAQACQALEHGERLARGRRGSPDDPHNGSAYPLQALAIGHPFTKANDLESLVNALKKAGWQTA